MNTEKKKFLHIFVRLYFLSKVFMNPPSKKEEGPIQFSSSNQKLQERRPPNHLKTDLPQSETELLTFVTSKRSPAS
jgi:hypothetical protein